MQTRADDALLHLHVHLKGRQQVDLYVCPQNFFTHQPPHGIMNNHDANAYSSDEYTQTNIQHTAFTLAVNCRVLGIGTSLPQIHHHPQEEEVTVSTNCYDLYLAAAADMTFIIRLIYYL